MTFALPKSSIFLSSSYKTFFQYPKQRAVHHLSHLSLLNVGYLMKSKDIVQGLCVVDID